MSLRESSRLLFQQIRGVNPFGGDYLPTRVPLFGLGRPAVPFPHLWNYKEPIKIFETFYWDAEHGMHKLEDLVDPADPLKDRFQATGERPKINSKGMILLNASFDDNASHQHVLVLTPVR